MKLLRPLNFIDCETTGLDIALDRVIELAILQLRPDGETSNYCWRFNPGIRISPQAQAVHGITAKDLKKCPCFSDRAREILGILARCDLAGFNVVNFDIPLLFEEFFRAGVEWHLAGTNIIDAATVFRTHERRNLSAALRFYCGQAHPQAHSAAGDVRACSDIVTAQLQRYPELTGKSVEALAHECLDRRQDLAGYILQDKFGECCYALGFDHGGGTGRRVVDDPWLGEWMLSRAFPEHTKRIIRQLLWPCRRSEAIAKTVRRKRKENRCRPCVTASKR
jgi:DNA polymerase III subunit epsilon